MKHRDHMQKGDIGCRYRVKMAIFINRFLYEQRTEWKHDKEVLSLWSTTRFVKGITQSIWINLVQYIKFTYNYNEYCCKIWRFRRGLQSNYGLMWCGTARLKGGYHNFGKCSSVPLQITVQKVAEYSLEAFESTKRSTRQHSLEDYDMMRYA
jgi:hypothetical protein